ncbi:META domain-containing protein [Marinobacter orientalis]|uniref:META domain-containing protein n=1 Tax=Marinobacter orientalis TaxID=1928859 RepID=A0A7Y0NLL4_9GAMM|nr:META domain-containing protein [Marinobacter orientalis]NMT63066.1 META domain-containing protein [Marinobacter orientalis]TGX51726.1 META domain-containing protein [Marinobacter orientalis]
MKNIMAAPGYMTTLFVVLLLAGCAGSTTMGDGDVVAMPLTNTYWQLVSVAGQPVPESDTEQKAHILFLDDGRVSGFSGCNQYMGDYRVRDENLLFDSMSSTRRACPDSQTEELLFAALAKTVGVNLEGIELRLLGESGEELAVFEASRMK